MDNGPQSPQSPTPDGPQSPSGPPEPSSPPPAGAPPSGPQSPGGAFGPPPPSPGGPFAPPPGPGPAPPPAGMPPAPAPPASPAPAGMPAPPPAAPLAYGGPVPPGGWQQPTQQYSGVLAGKALASWGARLGAYVIDTLVLLVPAAILFFALVGGAAGLSGGDEDVAAGALLGALLLWFLLMAVVYALYAPLLMARQSDKNGQTWGKQLLNVRVVRSNGERMTFGVAALREVVLKFLAVGITSSIIPLIPWLLNFLWPLWDDENRALHDMVASTRVVRE